MIPLHFAPDAFLSLLKLGEACILNGAIFQAVDEYGIP